MGKILSCFLSQNFYESCFCLGNYCFKDCSKQACREAHELLGLHEFVEVAILHSVRQNTLEATLCIFSLRQHVDLKLVKFYREAATRIASPLAKEPIDVMIRA